MHKARKIVAKILKKMRGFTLIELLVVIAIIGILAAVVLVSLGSTRNKASDSRIKSDLKQIHVMAEVFYNANNYSYDGAKSFATCWETANTTSAQCAAGIETSVNTLRADLTASGASPLSGLQVNSEDRAFCASVNLKTDPTKVVCVDASGVFKESSTTGCTATSTQTTCL